MRQTRESIIEEFGRYGFEPSHSQVFLEDNSDGSLTAHIGFRFDYEAYAVYERTRYLCLPLHRKGGEEGYQRLEPSFCFEYLARTRGDQLQSDIDMRGNNYFQYIRKDHPRCMTRKMNRGDMNSNRNRAPGVPGAPGAPDRVPNTQYITESLSPPRANYRRNNPSSLCHPQPPRSRSRFRSKSNSRRPTKYYMGMGDKGGRNNIRERVEDTRVDLYNSPVGDWVLGHQKQHQIYEGNQSHQRSPRQSPRAPSPTHFRVEKTPNSVNRGQSMDYGEIRSDIVSQEQGVISGEEFRGEHIDRVEGERVHSSGERVSSSKIETLENAETPNSEKSLSGKSRCESDLCENKLEVHSDKLEEGGEKDSNKFMNVICESGDKDIVDTKEGDLVKDGEGILSSILESGSREREIAGEQDVGGCTGGYLMGTSASMRAKEMFCELEEQGLEGLVQVERIVQSICIMCVCVYVADESFKLCTYFEIWLRERTPLEYIYKNGIKIRGQSVLIIPIIENVHLL